MLCGNRLDQSHVLADRGTQRVSHGRRELELNRHASLVQTLLQLLRSPVSNPLGEILSERWSYVVKPRCPATGELVHRAPEPGSRRFIRGEDWRLLFPSCTEP